MGCSGSKGDAKADPKPAQTKPAQTKPAEPAEPAEDVHGDAGDADAFPTAPEDDGEGDADEDEGGDFPSTCPTVAKVSVKDKDTETNTIDRVASNLSSISINLGVSAAAASIAQ